MKLRTVTGTDPADLRNVDQIRIRIVDGVSSGDLKEVYQQGIRLAVDPPTAGNVTTNKTGPITSNSVVVSVAGGTPPYTHSWTASDGITVDSPSFATTTFTATPPGIDGAIFGTAGDTVTDANGITASISVDLAFGRSS